MSIDPKELQRWQDRENLRLGQRTARHEGMEWAEVAKIAAECLPETAPPLPYEMTSEGIRMDAFRELCPEEFCQKPDRARLPDATAFDQVAQWNGGFPGPLATGATERAKTRAAWSALGRLHVKEGKSFAWFPVKRLITEFLRYESKDAADQFWRYYGNYDLLFVDDVDKINWSFDSESAALFQFYDWVYRERRPCITTTNRGQQWWTEKMTEAFARRLFKDAHYPVVFT